MAIPARIYEAFRDLEAANKVVLDDGMYVAEASDLPEFRTGYPSQVTLAGVALVKQHVQRDGEGDIEVVYYGSLNGTTVLEVLND